MAELCEQIQATDIHHRIARGTGESVASGFWARRFISWPSSSRWSCSSGLDRRRPHAQLPMNAINVIAPTSILACGSSMIRASAWFKNHSYAEAPKYIYLQVKAR